jgi:hypothetical protein
LSIRPDASDDPNGLHALKGLSGSVLLRFRLAMAQVLLEVDHKEHQMGDLLEVGNQNALRVPLFEAADPHTTRRQTS